MKCLYTDEFWEEIYYNFVSYAYVLRLVNIGKISLCVRVRVYVQQIYKMYIYCCVSQ
jgi:hypothetical protein